MPFSPAHNSSIPQEEPSFDLPPIFIIPGILGNSNELNSLADQLNNVCKNRRQIFIYEDCRLADSNQHNDTPDQTSLAKQAEYVASQMQSPHFVNYPIMLIGYSYGALLASAMVTYLKEQQYDPHLFLIDGPSAECSNGYFMNQAFAATKDLANICNYAAKLSNIKPHNFNEMAIKEIAKNKFLDRLTIMKNITLEQSSETNDAHDIECFNRYIAIATQNLRNIIEYNPLSDDLSCEKINLLLTAETAKKYSLPFGGWENHAQKINRVAGGNLESEQHTALLSNKENCLILANIIENVFTAEIGKEEFFSREFANIITERERKNPDINMKAILKQLLDSQKQASVIAEPSTADLVAFKNDKTLSAEKNHAIFDSERAKKKTEDRKSPRQQLNLFPAPSEKEPKTTPDAICSEHTEIAHSPRKKRD